jgi:hypothetical protein
MNTEPAKWEVKQKITGKDESAQVINQLICNGRVVHEVRGQNSYGTVKRYAEQMNAKGEPEPPVKTKLGVDGYSFKTPPKKAPNAPKTVMPSMQAWAKKHGLL